MVLLGAGARSKSSGVVRARQREPPLGRLGGQLDIRDEAELLEAPNEEPRDVELPRAQAVPGVELRVRVRIRVRVRVRVERAGRAWR
jgi:hypothetical protein